MKNCVNAVNDGESCCITWVAGGFVKNLYSQLS